MAQAKANRGILYVDEVNLLDDGLVDVVLDSAASGLNTVEREGVSIIHPAKFIMLGSGNPQVSCTSLLHSQHVLWSTLTYWTQWAFTATILVIAASKLVRQSPYWSYWSS